MPKKRELPSSLFEIFPGLLPHLIKIFEKCQLTPTELFILSQIKHFGVEHKGQRTFLGKHMNDILMELFRYSASQASKDIAKLIDRNLIVWIHLTQVEKKELYGDGSGKRWALALNEKGTQKIDEMKAEVNELYQKVTANVPGIILTPFSHALTPLTKTISKSLREPQQS
jgi:hypothetical protein